MRKLWILLLLPVLHGCFNNTSSLATYDQSPRMNQGLADNYHETQSPTEEYVNRVAKRVMVVSDRPANKYTFVVDNTSEPVLFLDSESNTVTISTGALRQLKDEAELAATLTMSMERLDKAPNVDRATINALYMAGYDPNAVLELQQQYTNYGDQQWLGAIFPTPPTASDMAATKTLLEKMPKGLQRGTENYNQIING